MNNKAGGKCHASMTLPFSKTKGFFCFSFNTKSPKDTLTKMIFFACHFSKTKQKTKKKQLCNDAFHVRRSQYAKN